MPTIETQRLVLRPFRDSDAARLAEIANDARISHMLGSMPHPFALANAHAYITASTSLQAAAAQFAICLKPSGELIGSVGYGPPAAEGKSPDETDFGYWIAVDHWSHGYAREAAQAAISQAFRTTGLESIDTEHLTINPASGRVLTRLGFLIAGERTCHSRASGLRKPSIHVRLTRARWSELHGDQS